MSKLPTTLRAEKRQHWHLWPDGKAENNDTVATVWTKDHEYDEEALARLFATAVDMLWLLEELHATLTATRDTYVGQSDYAEMLGMEQEVRDIERVLTAASATDFATNHK